jgi:F-type H+-transporting ATPase subunit b
MSAIRGRALTVTALVLAARSAAAQHAESAAHAEHVTDWSLLALHAFGLVVLIGVIVYFAREPLQMFLRDRSDGLRRQLDNARLALENARKANAAIRTRLESIADENEALVREAAELAETERARALERARAAAERVREEAKRVADQEIERARAELQSEAARLAISLAGEIVRNNLNPDDERRMVAEFVERIGRPT